MTTIARLATLVLLLTVSARAARAADENDEHRALKYFATGEYRQALDIYAKLYADTLHPTYLRNIARCYQNLGEADKAISSFREYLRKAKGLSPAERAEVEGYIAELEQKKAAQAAPPASSPAPSAAPPPAAAVPPPPVAPPPAPEPAAPEPAPLVGPPTVTATGSPPRDGDAAPVYTRWWFWAAAGGVAVAAIASVVLLSSDRSPVAGNLGAIDLTDKAP
jgi:tetratricopeptide (TPR) repeat protein